MRIINPLYDQAFKYLMDNEPAAKKILSVILEKEVISVQTRATEQALINKRREIPLSRFDFKAIIRSADSGEQNVLIEIQKSKNPDPIMRFRRYLGKNYIRTESYTDAHGQEIKKAIPIITIYILGFKLAEYNTPGILVNNCVIDATTKEPIAVKNEFVELLTHPSYILQIERLRPERKTKLEKFLSFFDQSKKTDDDFILEIDENNIDPDFEEIAKLLNMASQDEEMIDKLLAEEDIENAFDKLEIDLNLAIKEKEEAKQREDDAIREKEEAKQREDDAIREKEEAKRREDDAIREKEEAKQREEIAMQQLYESARQMKTFGMPTEIISKATNLTIDEIESL